MSGPLAEKVAIVLIDGLLCNEADILRRRGEHDGASRVLELRSHEGPDELADEVFRRAEKYVTTNDPYDYVYLKLALYRWRHAKSDQELLERARDRAKYSPVPCTLVEHKGAGTSVYEWVPDEAHVKRTLDELSALAADVLSGAIDGNTAGAQLAELCTRLGPENVQRLEKYYEAEIKRIAARQAELP